MRERESGGGEGEKIKEEKKENKEENPRNIN
jgi:hypothetical protein